MRIYDWIREISLRYDTLRVIEGIKKVVTAGRRGRTPAPHLPKTHRRVLRSRCLLLFAVSRRAVPIHLRPRPPRRQVLHYMCVPPPTYVYVSFGPFPAQTDLSFSPISHPACRVCHAGPSDLMEQTLLARTSAQANFWVI
jgi:hypothetical protein